MCSTVKYVILKTTVSLNCAATVWTLASMVDTKGRLGFFPGTMNIKNCIDTIDT